MAWKVPIKSIYVKDIEEIWLPLYVIVLRMTLIHLKLQSSLSKVTIFWKIYVQWLNKRKDNLLLWGWEIVLEIHAQVLEALF